MRLWKLVFATALAEGLASYYGSTHFGHTGGAMIAAGLPVLVWMAYGAWLNR